MKYEPPQYTRKTVRHVGGVLNKHAGEQKNSKIESIKNDGNACKDIKNICLLYDPEYSVMPSIKHVTVTDMNTGPINFSVEFHT
jgi:hypothetical protein